MNTALLYIDDPARQPEFVRRAAEILRSGGLCAIPTETVYGLGANALVGDAVRAIFAAKGRPQDNPLIVHIAEPAALGALCRDVPDAAHRLAEAFWPGPLTMILPSSGAVAPEVSAGLDTVAVRAPRHPVTLAILREAGVPVAAPSANLSGCPSPTTAEHVLHDLGGRIDAIVDSGPCAVGLESTVLDLTVSLPRILRPGAVTLAQIRTVCPGAVYDDAVLREVDAAEPVRSPGMKYRHYAPAHPILLLRGEAKAAAAYVRSRAAELAAVLCPDEECPLFSGVRTIALGPAKRPDLQARRLYAALRETDGLGPGTVLVRYPEGDDVATALENRLLRAAAFQIVDV